MEKALPAPYAFCYLLYQAAGKSCFQMKKSCNPSVSLELHDFGTSESIASVGGKIPFDPNIINMAR